MLHKAGSLAGFVLSVVWWICRAIDGQALQEVGTGHASGRRMESGSGLAGADLFRIASGLRMRRPLWAGKAASREPFALPVANPLPDVRRAVDGAARQ